METLLGLPIILLLVGIPLSFILLSVQPFWAIIDCAISETPKTRKSISIIFLIVFWSLSCTLYGLFFTKSKRLFYFTLITAMPLILLLLGTGILFLKDPSKFQNYLSTEYDASITEDLNTSMKELDTLSSRSNASLLVMNKKYQEAIDLFNKLIADNPKDLEFILQRAGYYNELGNKDLMNKDLELFFNSMPTENDTSSTELNIQKARAFILKNEYKSALEAIEEGLKIDPEDFSLKILKENVEFTLLTKN